MNRSVAAILVCGMLAALPAVGGMAEMGRKKAIPETGGQEAAGTDTAAGGGTVTIVANLMTFTHVTSAGETVDHILEALETEINMTGAALQAPGDTESVDFRPERGLHATHAPNSSEITIIGLAGEELSSLEIQNTDTAFGYVKAARDAPASRGGLRKVTETPSGVNDAMPTPGAATVRVDANGRFVSVATAGHTAASLNAAIVAALIANNFTAVEAGNTIAITQDNLTMGPVTVVSWEDNDTGITSIGAASAIVLIGPTLTEWGMILSGLLLLAGASILLTRRQAAASRLEGGTAATHWFASILVPVLLRRWLARTGAAAAIALALAWLAFGRPALHDAIGTLTAAGILAYVSHLWEAHRARRAR